MKTFNNLTDFLQLLKIKQYHGEEAILIFKRIIEYLRPKNKKSNDDLLQNWSVFMKIIEQDVFIEAGLYNLLGNIIIESNITDLLTDNGITNSATFAQQMKRIINEKIIPSYQDPEDINTVLQKVFVKKWDWVWLSKLPKEDVQKIIVGANNSIKERENDLATELYNAAKIVSYRIASLGLDKEIFIRANKKETLLSPFTQQNIDLLNILNNSDEIEKDDLINQLRTSLIQCKQSLVQLEKNSIETGTSINQTFLLRRLDQNIARLQFIISFLQKNKPLPSHHILQFLESSVHYLKTKNNLRNFASNNLNLLSYRIVDHTKDTGEKYITSKRTEYWKMFAAACGGGFIVSILVMIKFKIGTLHLPVFWEGFLFSLNYAVGFIAIQLLGFVLATKQPAMTASSIANALKGSDKKDFVQMSVIISQVCRTQFISIVGNVIMVIPFTALWLFLYEQTSDFTYLSEEAARNQIYSNHPLYSLSILYATIAGFFLFISGIVSGYVENRMVYAKIPERLEQHSRFRNILPKKWFLAWVHLLKNKSGAILGNATLGLLLGMSSFFGKILGLPIDIRHITFAGGNVTMGIWGGGSQDLLIIGAAFLGVLLIGIFNLLVSFSLAFYLALKARSLHLSDYPELSKTVMKHFFTKPLEFFFPPLKGYSTFKAKQDSNPFSTEL